MIDEAKRERMREASRRYRLRHPDRFKASCQKYRAKNLEVCRARNLANYYAHRESLLEKSRAWHKRDYEENKEKVLQRHKAWCLKNPEKKKASDKKIALKNRARRLQQCKDWWLKNGNNAEVRLAQSRRGKANYAARKSEILKRHAAWRKANKGYWSAVQAKRRLVESSAVNLGQIKAWMKRIRSKSTAICYYCQRCVPISEVHFDHIVPLSKGGPHSIENLCVSCQPCNNSKHAHLVRTWVRVGQQVLEL